MGKYQAELNESISVLSSEEMVDVAYSGLVAAISLLRKDQETGMIEGQVNSGSYISKILKVKGDSKGVICKDFDVFNALSTGIYIPGTQRTYWSGYFDIKVDEPPERGSVIIQVKKDDPHKLFEYATIIRIKRFPDRIYCACKHPVLYYKAYDTVIWKDATILPRHNETFFAISENGDMWSAHDKVKLRQGMYFLPLSGEMYARYDMRDNLKFDESFSHFGPGALSLLSDRKYLWNVKTEEPIERSISAVVHFGIEKEMVKSLLYARSLPRTVTGRLRPILHWVNAHERRLKSGIDIDVSKYLRGIYKFEIGNLNFEITEPRKTNTMMALSN